MKINQKLSICLIAGLVMILAVGLIRPVGAATATATQRMSFRSIGAQDGFIWESSEDNNKGYKLNSDHPTLNVGDDNIDRQYRAIFSFDTSQLPDTAVITWARIRVQLRKMVGWTGYSFVVWEVKSPYFGTSAGLMPHDFQNAASAKLTGQGINVNQYDTKLFGVDQFQYINLQGTTQIRMRYDLEDNDNMSGDYNIYYSGDAVSLATRPLLVVEFNIP